MTPPLTPTTVLPPNPGDSHSEDMLRTLSREEGARQNRVPGVRTVLVVFSNRGMAYDVEALRQKILLSYPDSTVFFMTTLVKPVGTPGPQRVDLLIDFVGPGERQGFFLAKKFRRMARVAVGRDSGFFRKRIYDRILDERTHPPAGGPDFVDSGRYVHRDLLHLAGVAVVQYGDTPPDLGKSIALDLPPLQKI